MRHGLQKEYRGYAKKAGRTIMDLMKEETEMRPVDIPSILFEEADTDHDKIRAAHKELMKVEGCSNFAASSLIFDMTQLEVGLEINTLKEIMVVLVDGDHTLEDLVLIYDSMIALKTTKLKGKSLGLVAKFQKWMMAIQQRKDKQEESGSGLPRVRINCAEEMTRINLPMAVASKPDQEMVNKLVLAREKTCKIVPYVDLRVARWTDPRWNLAEGAT